MGPFGGIRAAQLARYGLCLLELLLFHIHFVRPIKKLDRPFDIHLDRPIDQYKNLVRPFLSELGLVPLPSTLLIPTVQVLKICEK